MEPALEEMLLSEPDIAAWLEPRESDHDDDQEPKRRASWAR